MSDSDYSSADIIAAFQSTYALSTSRSINMHSITDPTSHSFDDDCCWYAGAGEHLATF